MTEPNEEAFTSPCKGEVDREAVGRGSRFSRTRPMTSRARRLRKNLTTAEQKLWQALRRGQHDGLLFRRQHPIGPYTLDFYCPELRLAIELDGGQHALATKASDDRRTTWLATKQIVVVRYWNTDVLQNLTGVLSDLSSRTRALALQQTPSPTLPLSGEGSEPASR